MRKILLLLMVGIFSLALVSAVYAATGSKVAPKKTNINKNYTNDKPTDVYAVTIRSTTASNATFNYIYSPSLLLHDAILAGLAGDLKDPFKSLIASVGAEMANALLFEYQATGDIKKAVDKLNKNQIAKIDWSNVAAVIRNQSIVPGRDAGTTVGEDDDAIDEGALEDIEKVNNKGGVDREYVLGSSSSVSYAYVDGVLQMVEDINLDLYKVKIHSITATKRVSPIVLDMTGNGKLEASNGQYLPHETTDLKNTIVADFYGDGFEIAMEWVGPNDGLLVAPKADGTIDMSCLFGTSGGYDTGYEKLSLYADNNGIVKGDALKGLSVWQDKNGNGIADAGEVTSCTELGITSIDVKHKGFVSSFQINGKTQRMWDWWPNAVELRTVAAK